MENPTIYHCISRVVDRRFVFGDAERAHFRMFMRMQENFSTFRLLSYYLMSNHFHLLMEVPPMPEGGVAGEELLMACMSHQGAGFEAERWKEVSARTERGDCKEAAAARRACFGV